MATDLNSEHLSFDEFELPPIETSPATQASLPMGVCCGLAIVLIGIAILVSGWVCSPPHWFQPTIVGVIWASLFLVGMAAGSVRRGSAWFASLAGCFVWFCQHTLQHLTSMVSAECGLIAVSSFSAGWLVTQLEFSGRLQPASATAVRRYQQWTIWDLALLTTFVAVICYALPRLESPLILLTQVGFVLLGGCTVSWIAYRWVYDDSWTLAKLLVTTAGSGLCIGLLCYVLLRQIPADELSMRLVMAWMLTGPLAVIAAQGLTVLAVLTAIRVDQGTLSTSQSPLPPNVQDSPTEGLRIYSA